jgi:hypothetical protein
MGRHEAPAAKATFDQVVDDYVTGRARELVRELDAWDAMTIDQKADAFDRDTAFDRARWIGSAAEILRELTRDA